MPQLKPEEVLRIVSADLKMNKLSHAQAAIRLKMRSKQTLSNLLSSKRYMSEMNAERFHEAFGYSKEFLMHGTGSLFEDTPSSEGHNLSINRLSQQFSVTKISEIETILHGDFEQVLNWFRDAFSRQGNKDLLALWAEITRYVDSVNIVTKSLKDYHGPDSREEFRVRFSRFRAECVHSIEEMINSISKEQ